MKAKNLIPEQGDGKNVDLFFSVDCENDVAAVSLFETAANRLKTVDKWEELAKTNTRFTLIPVKHASSTAEEKDKIQIDLPAPGSVEGKGYDYVEIFKLIEQTDIAENSSEILMQVRPCSDPTTRNNKIAHFFDSGATSSFLISRQGNVVTARYAGRNEKVNSEGLSLIAKARNLLVGGSALAGFSEQQWQALIEGLLATND